MSLYEMELEEARKALAEAGRDAGAFAFAMDYLPPDDDTGDGMFTQMYEVVVSAVPSGKSASYIGSIGRDWVGAFRADLAGGAFD